jgi:hypothetical protein
MMRRVAVWIILVIGVLHVHCACGALEAPLLLLSQASSDDADHHSHPVSEEACAADDGVVPPRQDISGPQALVQAQAAPQHQSPTLRPTSDLDEPPAVSVVIRIVRTEPSRAPPTS